MRRNLTPFAPTITLVFTLAPFAIAQPAPVTVQPWKEIVLDPDYRGAWVVAGDLTGAGAGEIVTARNVDRNDVHYTSAVAAQRLDGTVLWRWGDPTVGRRELHHDVPCQIHDWDGDGRDEIMAGYAMLNHDGSTRWIYASDRIDLAKGHCDCFRVVRPSRNPDEFRAVLTFCGANAIAMVNGHGQPVWEAVGHHFESVDVGPVIPGSTGIQFVVDIDHRPWGEGPVWVLDEQGEIRTRIMTDYARHHALLDWTGDGVNEIVVAQSRTLYDGNGRPRAVLAIDPADDLAGEERLVLTGDFCGDGVPDILLTTRAINRVLIYRNLQGRRPHPPAPLGTGLNVTLY